MDGMLTLFELELKGFESPTQFNRIRQLWDDILDMIYLEKEYLPLVDARVIASATRGKLMKWYLRFQHAQHLAENCKVEVQAMKFLLEEAIRKIRSELKI